MLRIRTTIGTGVIVTLALATLITTVTASTAWASGPRIGHDVSYPQCGGELPTGSAFGIVGINNGRPFSTNPCLASQYRWAVSRPSQAAVYVNTSNPAPNSAYYWPRSGSKDPVLCKNGRSRTDPGCAYNYGWHAAADALATGKKLGPAVLRHTWWLDVETTNRWNGDGTSNTALLQGMYDYLRSHGVRRVGLYATSSHWREITGGYTTASAGEYRRDWKPHFTPRYALHSAPLWIATGANSSTARTACSTSFTGGPTRMVQFPGTDGFSNNLIC
jgi:hypothetical protein